MLKLVVIAGVTASGKSRLAVELASLFGGEIISADAYQVYKGMDIGTNKTTLRKMGGVPHHLVDCVEVNEDWDVSIFQARARKAIADIAERGKLPIVCGGTGFYINALIKNYVFLPLPKRNDYTGFSNEQLHAKLKEADPIEAERIPINNRRRLEKALDFIAAHRVKKSEHDAKSNTLVYDALIIFLDPPKESIINLIRNRTRQMLQDGWPQEVQMLLNKYPSFTKTTAAKAIGYGQIMNNDLDAEKISDQIIDYCRRQRTWFVNKNAGRTLVIKDGYGPKTVEVSSRAIKAFLGDSVEQARAA